MPPTDAVTAYARAVVKGRVPGGTLHRAACARHLRDLDTRKARGLTWDVAAAMHVVYVVGHFTQYKGEWAGQPLTLQPWQAFIVGSLFGWKRADGTRRFRTAFVEVPRGNGKSSLAATLLLYGAFLDGEPGSECYSVATNRDQARIVFDTARWMAKRTPALASRCTIQEHNLHQLSSASKLEPLSADAKTLDGKRPHIVVADEVHAHPDSRVIDVMLTGMGTRRQPLLFEITTAGIDRHGPWWAHREYTRMIVEGDHADDSWFGAIFNADLDADWTAEKTWRVANPGYGVQVKPDYMRDECTKAQRILGRQNTYRRLHLGQLVEQQDRWLDMAAWDATVAARPIDLEALAGRPCVAGLDLSTRVDLSACVLVFSDPDGGVTVVPRFWCPDLKIAERSRVDRVPYEDWAAQGYLTPTPGNVVDYDRIRADVNDLARRYRITELAFDPWNATQIATQLQGDGLRVVELRQGYKSLSEPTKALQAMVTDGKVRHGGHPILRWMARNIVVIEDSNGNVRPDKEKAIDKIDGMVALVMGLSRLIAQPDDGGSLYSREELLVL